MIHLYDHGVFLLKNGNFASECFGASKEKAREKTMAWKILEAHNHSGNMERLELKFDAGPAALSVFLYLTSCPTVTIPYVPSGEPLTRMTMYSDWAM